MGMKGRKGGGAHRRQCCFSDEFPLPPCAESEHGAFILPCLFVCRRFSFFSAPRRGGSFVIPQPFSPPPLSFPPVSHSRRSTSRVNPPSLNFTRDRADAATQGRARRKRRFYTDDYDYHHREGASRVCEKWWRIGRRIYRLRSTECRPRS